jgi:hypothetical protein
MKIISSIYMHLPAILIHSRSELCWAAMPGAVTGTREVDYKRFLRRFDVAVNKEKWVA